MDDPDASSGHRMVPLGTEKFLLGLAFRKLFDVLDRSGADVHALDFTWKPNFN